MELKRHYNYKRNYRNPLKKFAPDHLHFQLGKTEYVELIYILSSLMTHKSYFIGLKSVYEGEFWEFFHMKWNILFT